MKSELELQKDFINNPELQDQLNFLKNNPIQEMQGIVMVDAFLKGIRDLGYKDTSFAFNELNDNSFQAGARNIHYDLIGSGKKNIIQEIIVYDDGHGMIPDMLRIAVAWGGGHRQGSRKGFGKYGYGLPSACLGMAKKYTIYSKTKETNWHKITFDISSLDNQEKPDLNKIVIGPEPCELPSHIKEFEGKNYKVTNLNQGTIIQLEDIDKVKPFQVHSLKNNFLNDFGQTYFKLLEATNIYVDNVQIQPVDVLFATPSARGFKDELNDLSVDIDNPNCYGEINIPITFEDENKADSEIVVRWSKIPGLFAIRNPEDSGYDSVEEAFIHGKTSITVEKKSYRWKVLRQNYGIVFRRFGRKMDVVVNSTKLGGFNLQNYSNYWKCEVNFPAELDEHFEVTTSKQQITPSEKIIAALEKAGVFKLLNRLEREYYDDNMVRKSQRTNPDSELNEAREAEIIALETALTQGAEVATTAHEERASKAKKRMQERIEEIAAEKNITVEQAKTEFEVLYNRPRICREKALGKSQPFIFMDEVADSIEVLINTDHSFFKNFYCGNGSNKNTQTTWQLFLLQFAENYYKQSPDNQDFLKVFMNNVGESLSVAARKTRERNIDEGQDVLDDDILESDHN